MKQYTLSSLNASCHGLSLLALCEQTDWSEEEFDEISNLEIGQSVGFDALTIERTK